MVETFGPAESEQDGRSVHAEGSVLVSYAGDNRAVWITFVLDLDDLTLTIEEGESLAQFYRPPDARLLSETSPDAGTIRRVYSSATLQALFGAGDVDGRPTDRYVELIHVDPGTQRALSIDMALGEQP
jgi:hypothetical protein